MCSEGKVPQEVAPYLCGGRLHGANKKDGGLRPVNIGELIRRLTSKCVAGDVADIAAMCPLSIPRSPGYGRRGID